MRRTVVVFAVMASLLMLACAAGADPNNTPVSSAAMTKKPLESDQGLFGNLKDTIMSFIGPFLQSGVLTNLKLSSVLGLFDRTLEYIKLNEENIDTLHEKCLKEHKEIESIHVWAQAASGTAKQSAELIQKLQLIETQAETGKKQLKQIEKQKEIVEDTKKEADAAIQDFDAKQVSLVQMVVDLLTAGVMPSTGKIIGLATGVVPIVTGMFSSFKKVNKAGTTTEEAFQAAQLASKNIKQYLTESQEIQRALQTSELKHAAPHAIMGPNGTIISDVSSGFSLLQNAVFLTLVAAFLIADKPVW